MGHPPGVDEGADLDRIAAELGGIQRLGHGGEAVVWALDETRVVRVHRQPQAEHVRRIAAFIDRLDRDAAPFALPELLEVGEADGTTWAIERRLPGRALDGVLQGLRGDVRRRALRAYLDGAGQVRRLGVPDGWDAGCGEVFMEPPIRTERWPDLLAGQLQRQLDLARPVLTQEVPHLDAVEASVLAGAAAEPDPGERSLVHGDFFPGNVLVGPDLAVTAVLDWSWLTVIGDPDHELRSAVVFLRGSRTGTAEDEAYCTELLVERWGEDARNRIARARRFEAARFSPYDEDPGLHGWCVDVLSGRLAEGAPA